MRLKRIALSNFRQYRRKTVIDFPEPREGRPLVLIGANNGVGKTSLLEAIHLALFGPPARSPAHAGFISDGGLKEGNGDVILGVDFEANGRSYAIERHFTLRSRLDRTGIFEMLADHRKRQRERLDLRSTLLEGTGAQSKGAASEEYTGEQEIRQFMEQVMPAEMHRFFIFDAEEIREFAEAQDDADKLREAIEDTLGVGVWRRLLGHLDSRLRSYRDWRSQNDPVVEQLKRKARLAELNSELSQIDEEVAEKREEISRLVVKKDALARRIEEMEAKCSPTAVEERVKTEQRRDEAST